MCNPVAIALSLTAAGSAAQAAGARRAAKAMEGARVAESIRQKGFQDEANKVVDESLSKSGRGSTEQGMKEAAAERAAASDAAVAAVRKPVEATGANLSGDQSGNKVMATESDLQANKNLGFAAQQGRAKSDLLSFNDITFQNAINNARAGQQLATTGNFMRGSAGVLPVEVEAASRKGDNLKTLGTLLSTAGTVVGMGAGADWWKAAPEVGTPVLGEAGKITAPIAPEPGKILNLTGYKPLPNSIPGLENMPYITNSPSWKIMDAQKALWDMKYGHLLNKPGATLFNLTASPIK